ncbi:uroporphyrinogen-III C-methyltransferase [Janthinobacterium sp. 17J80-10]|uniref:uroporphyrinogen-III C-methyltransferase n=1 Tax=Janthinobacterium sp. 17J80-10 TaxID=2497863 RepID=UPI00100541BD|nr:uroporphyrinogen-III C-methyltransferase [Janthinobacterium sp. 17J80-10]QAU35578.1 uroporphyrinogen-III C-methyltransferase [Janthinobacterium sp. 17J80-10]
MQTQTTSPAKVYLVGAGPGDPELLTLKAVRAIGCANVLLVDDLVNPAVLEHAPASARIVYVGKRGGCQSTPQAFIERLMIAEAQAGRVVVRLKGGDPFIFGRGGEEREHLRDAGIDVEVVNGISSGLAAPASLGIPLTHRDWSQGAVFVTGHGKTKDANPDWDALAKLTLTLVIYMGVGRSSEIQAALLAGGKAADTPVAVIQSATGTTQAQLITTLGRLPEDLAASQLGSPAIIVIGDVVRCADFHADRHGITHTDALVAEYAATM